MSAKTGSLRMQPASRQAWLFRQRPEPGSEVGRALGNYEFSYDSEKDYLPSRGLAANRNCGSGNYTRLASFGHGGNWNGCICALSGSLLRSADTIQCARESLLKACVS